MSAWSELLNLAMHASVLHAVSPEREKGEELCPLVPPFSLLLREEAELGLDVDALLENWRVLQSEKGAERNGKNWDIRYVTAQHHRIHWYTTRQWLNSCIKSVFYLSSRWGVLCTEHPENSSPGSILSASAFWAGWITSGWCGSKTQWSIWNPFPHSPHSFLKNLETM